MEVFSDVSKFAQKHKIVCFCNTGEHSVSTGKDGVDCVRVCAPKSYYFKDNCNPVLKNWKSMKSSKSGATLHLIYSFLSFI